MKRFLILVVLLAGLLFVGVSHSRADTNMGNGLCMTGPYNSVDLCPSPTAAPREPIIPNKVLALGSPIPAPAGVTYYTVDITSQVVCFALDEPIDVYTMGGEGSAVLHPSTPGSFRIAHSQVVEARVDPTTTTARLALEVVRKGIGPAGLVVKAVWPQEQVERLVRVIDAAPATVTPTAAPGQPTNSPTPIPTSTQSPQPTTTGTPGPTATVTPSSLPLFARTCVDPRVAVPRAPGTVYIQTAPGALCTASVRFTNGTTPRSFDSRVQTAAADGFALFPFERASTTLGGVVKARCTRGSESVNASTTFSPAQTTP